MTNTQGETAADIVDRLNARAAKIKGYIASSQIVVDLLAPQMKLFEDRAGHDIYTVRMAADHQSSIRTQSKELAEFEDAAAEIARLRARVDELEGAGNKLASQARSYQRGMSGTLPLGAALNAWDRAAAALHPTDEESPDA